MTSCLICLEGDSSASSSSLPTNTTAATAVVSSSWYSLQDCGHTFCEQCLDGWIRLVECTVTGPDPSCPHCRCPMRSDEIHAILGRPLRPRKSLFELQQERQRRQHDDFTRAYFQNLEQNGTARKCPSCNVWIILEEQEGTTTTTGNVVTTCHCGCRFCFCCGRRGDCAKRNTTNRLDDKEDDESNGTDPFYEEDEPVKILEPLFQGEDWYTEYEDSKSLEPLFLGQSWVPIETELEECNRLRPLFQGDWNIPGNTVPAHEGVFILAKMWEDAMKDDDVWDDACCDHEGEERGSRCLGANLFDPPNNKRGGGKKWSLHVCCCNARYHYLRIQRMSRLSRRRGSVAFLAVVVSCLVVAFTTLVLRGG